MDYSRALLDRLVAWSPVLLLGGLAALTYWLDAQIAAAPAPSDGSRRHDPDMYVENVRAIAFDAKGAPAQVLSAARGDHFPDDDSTVFTQPNIALTETGQPGFHVTSDSAKLAGDRADAWFNGNVRAVRDAETAPSKSGDKPAGAVTLATEYMHVMPNTKDVETDKPVTITETRGIMRGGGLQMNLDTKKFTLAAPVSGTFEPQVIPQSK